MLVAIRIFVVAEWKGRVVIIIIIIIIIKKRSAVQGWERVMYTLSVEYPSPTIPTYRQKEEKGKKSRRL